MNRSWYCSLSFFRSAYSTTQSAQLHYISGLTNARPLSDRLQGSAFDEAALLLKILSLLICAKYHPTLYLLQERGSICCAVVARHESKTIAHNRLST